MRQVGQSDLLGLVRVNQVGGQTGESKKVLHNYLPCSPVCVVVFGAAARMIRLGNFGGTRLGQADWDYEGSRRCCTLTCPALYCQGGGLYSY